MSVFGRGKEGFESNDIETVIGATVKIEGKFVGKGNIMVAGAVSGSIKTDQDIHIAAGASINASIDAKNVHVAGEVHGNIKAAERFELTETGKLHGDVEARTLAIHAGAVLNGKCTMSQQPVAEPVSANTDASVQGRGSKHQRKAEVSV